MPQGYSLDRNHAASLDAPFESSPGRGLARAAMPEEVAFLTATRTSAGAIRYDISGTEPDLFPLATRAAIILGSCCAFWLGVGTLIN